MINFESTSVAQLRALLTSQDPPVCTEEEANAIKGKTNIVYEVKKAIAGGLIKDYSAIQEDDDAIEIPLDLEPEDENVAGQSFEDLDLNTEEVADGTNREVIAQPARPAPKPKTLIPKIYSIEWQDFVLKQFTDDELLDIGKNKYPTVVGLRRVVEMLLGEIVFSGPTQIFPSLDGNEVGRASIGYEVRIAWRADNNDGYLDINSELPIRVFGAAAEAWSESIHDARFKPFPLTIAETRAEGRALRKALFLKTQSAEELLGAEMPTNETANAVTEYDENAVISGQQVSTIRLMCEKLNIDVDKFAPDVENMSKKDGVSLIKKINEYQRGECTIPKELFKE